MDHRLLLDKLLKLKALADRGEGGEKETAARMLSKMLDRHGLKMEDLEKDEDELSFLVEYDGYLEFELLTRLYCFVTNSNAMKYRQPAYVRTKLTLSMTRSQFMVFESYWDTIRKHHKQSLEEFSRAYRWKNIPDPDVESAESKLTDAEIESLRRSANMMNSAPDAGLGQKRLTNDH